MTAIGIPFKQRTMASTKVELERLRQVEEAAFKSRSRFREREYLGAVYELYSVWRNDKHSKANAWTLAKFCKLQPRPTAHPIRVIIDCTSPDADDKTKSRWTLALRFAHQEKVEPTDLASFLAADGEGGLAGRARAYAAARAEKIAAARKQARKRGVKSASGNI
jgi:hypothetical protein